MEEIVEYDDYAGLDDCIDVDESCNQGHPISASTGKRLCEHKSTVEEVSHENSDFFKKLWGIK